MFRNLGKRIANKFAGSLVGKAVKYGFWASLFAFPTAIVGTVGVPVVAVTAVVIHSGLVEYTASYTAFSVVSAYTASSVTSSLIASKNELNVEQNVEQHAQQGQENSQENSQENKNDQLIVKN